MSKTVSASLRATCLRASTHRQTHRQACPPLTMDDLSTLKGEPMVKMEPSRLLKSPNTQEWVYFSPAARLREHYLFKNGHLVGWKQMRG